MKLASNEFPRISFGIIVLNGEPFTRYCLRQLYPYAYEIIVVEGGSEKAAGFAPQGRSTDGTLEALREFKAQEDPENKLKIVTKEGFWSEKDEQSQTYAQRATGDYLWQVDIDEFYRGGDIEKVRAMLATDPKIDAVSFKQYPFWGSPGIVADGFRLRSDRSEIYHRLFKWGQNYQYQTHRPPTVLDEGGVNLQQKRWINGEEMAKRKVFLFHYSLLFPIQVRNKCRYYATPTSVTSRSYVPGILDWAENAYFHMRRPFRVHNVYRHLSWLRRIDIMHPEEAGRMWQDALCGMIKVELRDNRDAEALIDNRYYQWAAILLSLMATMLKHPPLKWVRKAFLRVGNRRRRRRLNKEDI